MVGPDRPQMAIHCIHFVFLIIKVTDRRLEYEILIASQLQKWLHECASVLQEKKVTEHEVCVLNISTIFAWNISHSKKK
jgi:hypothetical protein